MIVVIKDFLGDGEVAQLAQTQPESVDKIVEAADMELRRFIMKPTMEEEKVTSFAMELGALVQRLQNFGRLTLAEGYKLYNEQKHPIQEEV